MFRSAIVQYLMDYSDREMEQAARYHIVIKWFLGIPVEDTSYEGFEKLLYGKVYILLIL
jgi:IS5 family transposase